MRFSKANFDQAALPLGADFLLDRWRAIPPLIRFSRVHFDQAAPRLGVVFLPDRWRAMFTELRSMACQTALQRRHLSRAGKRKRRRRRAAAAEARRPVCCDSAVALAQVRWERTVLAAPALQGPNAFGGDVNKQMAAAKASDDADRNQFWKFWQHPLGYTNPLATQDAPRTSSAPPIIHASVTRDWPSNANQNTR